MSAPQCGHRVGGLVGMIDPTRPSDSCHYLVRLIDSNSTVTAVAVSVLIVMSTQAACLTGTARALIGLDQPRPEGSRHHAEEATGIGAKPARANDANADASGEGACLLGGRDGEEWLGYVELRLRGLSA